jgi:hypothetical protein
LRPDGKIILTTPFIWPLHEEPRDFYRYSPHGLRQLAGEAGFTDAEVIPISGQWGTIALLSAYALRESPAARSGRILDKVALLGQKLGARLDRFDFKPWMSWNHLLVARKSSTSALPPSTPDTRE